MKIAPINSSATKKEQTNFKGKFEYYSGQRPFLTASEDFHPDSSMETILGKFHDNRTGKIYFADPMEPISDETKLNADYIVYDNEPAYPDVNFEVSKNYFGTQRVNYKTQFENIRDYFYRREKAGWADKAEAQYQQWQAAECIRLYDEAGDLRYQKESLEDKVNEIQNKIKQSENSISLTNDLIAEKQAELAGITGIATALANKDNIAKIQGKIQKLQTRLAKLNKDVSLYKSVLETESPKINEIKAKLIPLFDKLKNFYAQQGIRKF